MMRKSYRCWNTVLRSFPLLSIMSRFSYQSKQCEYKLSHNYYAIHYHTIPLLHLALPYNYYTTIRHYFTIPLLYPTSHYHTITYNIEQYNYYTPTLLDCTQPYPNCTSRHFTITLPTHHHTVLDLT